MGGCDECFGREAVAAEVEEVAKLETEEVEVEEDAEEAAEVLDERKGVEDANEDDLVGGG